MRTDALIIMAKAPHAGSVKTRLRGHLDDPARVRLYEGLLQGAVARLRSVPGADTMITFSPPDEAEYFGRFGLPLFPQQGDTLGQRMANALLHVLSMGYARAALVGADIPALDAGVVKHSLGLLQGADVVFGPAADGGYYLVAMGSPHAVIFDDVEWSTPDTLRQSLARAHGAGLSAALGPMLHDVDTVEDLMREGLL